MRRRSPGWWLQFLAFAHAGVAVVLHRDALAEIAGDKLVGTVPDRGDRATAFWFTVVAPTLWLAGRLLRSAESTGDLGAQRTAGRVLAGLGLVGGAAMPLSPFWVVAAVGAGALRRGSRSALDRHAVARWDPPRGAVSGARGSRRGAARGAGVATVRSACAGRSSGRCAG